MIESKVLRALQQAPASGGALIERLELAGPAVVVYGALAKLAARGEIVELGRGPGERVWGAAGAEAAEPRAPGLPASYSLDDEQIGVIDREVGRMTTGLPQHYFEELRRAAISLADRRGGLGLERLGEPRAVRRYLLRVERGKTMPLRLRKPVRWPLGVLAVLAVIALLRLFVVGVYTVPSTSISMAPALIPAAEGGDALVVANLLAGRPERGDVVIFRLQGKGKTYVKRVMGLEGETIAIKGGDLIVNGSRLVKERDLLDRLKVPLDGLKGSENRWRLKAHAGFVLPDGKRNPPRGDCRDVVVSGKATGGTLPGTVTIVIREGRPAAHTVVLGTRGGAAVAGREVATGRDFRLKVGSSREFWVTNADGCFRVEIDGEEVARALIPVRGPRTTVEVVVDGSAELWDLEVFRDLIYDGVKGEHTWEVGRGEVFVLGDNSFNSRDSRRFGAVSLDWLLGEVFCVIWPPSRIRRIH